MSSQATLASTEANVHAEFATVVSQRFGHQDGWALVIGDLMLDRYLIGQVQRISPEAPVPVVLIKEQLERAGGAANVAANLASLGIKTQIAGCVGQDNEANALIQLIASAGINTQSVYRSPHRPTVTKTRVLGGHQQMLRLDQEITSPFLTEESSALQALALQALDAKPSMVILSDYAKGVLTDAVCQSVITAANAHNIPVLVDPKGKDYSKYHGATALTPNKREAADACGVDIQDTATLLEASNKLRSSLALDFLAVTRGEEGITVIDDHGSAHYPATAKQVFDVSGAGDTVIATVAAGMMHGLNYHQAFQLANIAAGIVVGKVGTVPVDKEELMHTLASQTTQHQADKICQLPELARRAQFWKQSGERIVFTNGCFDLLHAGHVTYLEAAKQLGDKLILGLNTDRSVSALKGPTRPVIHEQDRARVLAALEAVDAVILFDEDTPLTLINAIRPDILVKGSDYTEDQVVGGTEVKSWGGKVALVDVVPGRSTSNIIQKLAQ